MPYIVSKQEVNRLRSKFAKNKPNHSADHRNKAGEPLSTPVSLYNTVYVLKFLGVKHHKQTKNL